MNKIAYFFWITVTLLSIFVLDSQLQHTEAQIRGEDSREFFEEGNQQMEQNIQELEDQQQLEQNQEREEEKLEQNLNIQQRGPQIREVPDIPAALDENVPESPDQEVEIKF